MGLWEAALPERLQARRMQEAGEKASSSCKAHHLWSSRRQRPDGGCFLIVHTVVEALRILHADMADGGTVIVHRGTGRTAADCTMSSLPANTWRLDLDHDAMKPLRALLLYLVVRTKTSTGNTVVRLMLRLSMLHTAYNSKQHTPAHSTQNTPARTSTQHIPWPFLWPYGLEP